MSETVLYDHTDGVATVTLNRPDAMNALDRVAKAELLSALDRAGGDSDVRAVLLTGSGKAFCVGQDLREHAETLQAGGGLGDTVRLHYNPIIRVLTEMPKPVVAGVNGAAAGAGVSLALACDFRVLARNTTLSMAFANIGLTADSGASWLLPRFIGRARAMELLMLGEQLTAQRALELGLATAVAPAEDMPEPARELATRLASGPTVAFHAIRSSIDFGETHDLPHTLEREADLQAACAQTADHRNATDAFLNKQRPAPAATHHRNAVRLRQLRTPTQQRGTLHARPAQQAELSHLHPPDLAGKRHDRTASAVQTRVSNRMRAAR